MDMSDKDRIDLEKRNVNPMNYHSPSSTSSDWRFNSANITSSMGLGASNSQMAAGQGDLVGPSSYSSASITNSFVPVLWDHPTNSHNLGFYDFNVQNNASSSNTIGIGKGSPAYLRGGLDGTLYVGWNPASTMLKDGVFLPNASGMLPRSLSQFPADSAFIKRAARFSCFNGGNFGDMVNSFGNPESMSLYSRGRGMMQVPEEAFTGSESKTLSCGQGQKPLLNVGEASKEASMSVDTVGIGGGSALKDERKSESFVKSHDEARQGVGGPVNESDEAESDGDGREEPSMLERNCGEPSTKSISSKKRKRSGQDAELDRAKGTQQSGEVAKDNSEIQQKGDQTLASSINKDAGKQGKQGSLVSDSPKEEYIHVRARRGQATNSHSLAERVRREKISERMKFLQELVPGCSKVTGKAVMLDEIINYVQSLQHQVEFLSMKLATVNPRLDFNKEGLLAKDIFPSQAIPSSTLPFSSEMPMAYPPLHLSQPGLLQAALPGVESHSDILRRTINSQMTHMTAGLKEPSQLPNVWDNELHNVVDRSYGTNAPQDSQDINGSLSPGHMKVEL